MNRRTAAGIILFILFAVLALAGCAAFSLPEKPRITLADIQVHEIRNMETSFLVQLRVTNPNTEPLEIEGLSCDVELDGRRFASGVQGERRTIPPYGSELVEMEVHSSVLEMVSSVLGVIRRANEPDSRGEPVGYRLNGKVRVKSGGFSHNLPFVSEGELKM